MELQSAEEALPSTARSALVARTPSYRRLPPTPQLVQIVFVAFLLVFQLLTFVFSRRVVIYTYNATGESVERSLSDDERNNGFAKMFDPFGSFAFVQNLMVGGLMVARDERTYYRGTLLDWMPCLIFPTLRNLLFPPAEQTRPLWVAFYQIASTIVLLYVRQQIVLEQQLCGTSYANYLMHQCGRMMAAFLVFLPFFGMTLADMLNGMAGHPLAGPWELQVRAMNVLGTRVPMLLIAIDYLYYSRERLGKRLSFAQGARTFVFACVVLYLAITLALISGIMLASYSASDPDYMKRVGMTGTNLFLMADVMPTLMLLTLSSPAVAAFVRSCLASCGLVQHHKGAPKYDLFLSHDWGVDGADRDNHARVRQLNELLRGKGVAAWFDEEQMAGNVVDRMTEGIDRSTCVLVCVTSAYIKKVAGQGPRGSDDNCKREFEYACLRKGVEGLVAVVMEDAAKTPADWLGPVGFNLGTTLYVDASADDLEAAAEDVRARLARLADEAHMESRGAALSAALLLRRLTGSSRLQE